MSKSWFPVFVTCLGIVLVAQGVSDLVNSADGVTQIELTDRRIVDADTIEGTVEITAEKGEELPWNIQTDTRPITIRLLKQRIRVHGVDAFELSTEKGRQAKGEVAKLLVGKTVSLEPKGKDHFGRLLARVTITDDAGAETVLADWLVKNGHGVVYRDK